MRIYTLRIPQIKDLHLNEHLEITIAYQEMNKCIDIDDTV